MVALELLRAVSAWREMGMGEYSLHFIRDKEKREVDFLIARDGVPWVLVEVKKSAKEPLSPALRYFAQQLNVHHAYQAVLDMDYVEADCFTSTREGIPLRVPLRTLLAQLP